MARLNVPRSVADRPDATANYEGGLAFRVSPEMELYLAACTSLFGEDKYYTTGSQEHDRLVELIGKVDPLFALRLAEYVRQKMYLRTVPQVILAEVAARVHGAYPGLGMNPVRVYAPRIAIRADEPMEVLAYWIRTRGSKSKLPNALKRGLADALTRFDAYELAKYDRKGLVRLKDAIQILHPKPKNAEQSELFRRALDGTLPPAETWEREVSLHGNRPEVWDRIAPKMGLMALLRNLRNMAKAGATEALEVAKAALRDPERVRRSMILPFRFLAAYREIQRYSGDPEILAALNTALEASVEAVPDLPGRTVVLVDVSGSMDGAISSRSLVRRVDIAATLAAIIWRKTGARVLAYSTHNAWVDLHGLSILQAADRIAHALPHEGTWAYKAMMRLVSEQVEADRIIILSDEQSYGASYYASTPPGAPLGLVDRTRLSRESVAYWWAEYRRRYPNAHLWDIDLAGYGTVQFAPDDPSVTILAGWSDQVLTLIRAVETREEVVAALSNG